MKPETIQLLGLISLRTLAECDPIELLRTTDLSRRELDQRIADLVKAQGLEDDFREVNEVRSRLYEIQAINAEAETQIEKNFLLRNLGGSALQHAFRMALAFSRTADAVPPDLRTTTEGSAATPEVRSSSREVEFARLGVMRLLRELPEYVAAFDYPVKGRRIDCLIKPTDSEHPVIFVEAKMTVRSLEGAREAVAQLRKAGSWMGP